MVSLYYLIKRVTTSVLKVTLMRQSYACLAVKVVSEVSFSE